MSRSNRNREEGVRDSPAFGAGFEVGRSVKDVYLKKISVKEAVYGDTPYYKLHLHFLKNNQWLTKVIPALPREAFDSDEQYNKSKLLIQQYLENLCYCYMPGSQMKRIMFDSTGYGIVGTVRLIVRALQDRKFWEVPICLKTVPMPDGGVSIGKYPPFMNRQTHQQLALSYDRWEEKMYKNWILKTDQK